MKQILCCVLALAISRPVVVQGQSDVQFGGIISFQEDFGDNLHPYNTSSAEIPRSARSGRAFS